MFMFFTPASSSEDAAEDTGSSLSRTTSPLWVIGADLCPAVWNLSPFFESNAQEAICNLPALPL